MTLSPNQKEVLMALYTWIKNPQGGFVTIGGYAGTGKTTLIAVLRHLMLKAKMNKKIAFVSYTGKASQVLLTKLDKLSVLTPDDYVGTIHGLIYKPKVDKHGRIIRWVKVRKIEYDLIVVDEASMVTRDIWEDLLTYGVPIVAVGDHGQLPPVGEDFNLMEQPQLLLEQIFRQAQLNPIVEVAELVRQGASLSDIQLNSTQFKLLPQHQSEASELVESLVLGDSDYLILCGRNQTRIKLNNYIRSLQGRQSQSPTPGDRLVCLKNNYDNPDGPIYNGMIGYLKRIKPVDKHWYEVDIDFPLEGRNYQGHISAHQFNHPGFLTAVEGLSAKTIGDRFDYGYALTVHKAQGSQAHTVVIYEDNAAAYTGEQYSRWLYTAVTRAVERLVIIY